MHKYWDIGRPYGRPMSLDWTASEPSLELGCIIQALAFFNQYATILMVSVSIWLVFISLRRYLYKLDALPTAPTSVGVVFTYKMPRNIAHFCDMFYFNNGG